MYDIHRFPHKTKTRWSTGSPEQVQNMRARRRAIGIIIITTVHGHGSSSPRKEMESKPGILMTYPMSRRLEELLDGEFRLFRLWEARDASEYVSCVRGVACNTIVGASGELIESLPLLEVVVTCSVGLDQVDLGKCRKRNIAVAYTPDVLTDDVADLAIGLMLDTLRHISAADRYVRRGFWPVKGDYILTTKVRGGIAGRTFGPRQLAQPPTTSARLCSRCSIAHFLSKALSAALSASLQPALSSIQFGPLPAASATSAQVLSAALSAQTLPEALSACCLFFARRRHRELSGKHVGIVGLGRIGLAVAKRAEAFGCSIAYHSRSKNPDVSFMYHSTVIDLAASSDILVVACPLTKETFHIINQSVLAALGKKGTLINIGRGSLVDENELVKALVEGRLGGAGLDVYKDEPNLPEELFSMDNVVLLPHVGTKTWETRTAMADLMVANFEAYFSKKPLLTPVEL